jgi:required for meiotic nuclear division protein 1
MADPQIASSSSKPSRPESWVVRAILLGGRIDTKGFDQADAIASAPLTLQIGGGTTFLFRYGAAVLVRVSAEAEQKLLTDVRCRLFDPINPIEIEQTVIDVRSDADERVDPSGTIVLREASLERLQVVASVLSKSLVLAHYETRIASVFDHVEPLADQLERRGRVRTSERELLQQIGYVRKVQHFMVGRLEIEEKPEILWDHPELERLYSRLEDEYELRERSRAIDRKLELIHETVGTLVQLVEYKSSLRLEWYVIILILAELALTVFERI